MKKLYNSRYSEPSLSVIAGYDPLSSAVTPRCEATAPQSRPLCFSEEAKRPKNLIKTAKYKSRKAFTIIELITVIVIVAILSAIAIPRLFVEDKLAQAAEEIITNLRYTQHLALTEDEFNRSNPHWERLRWRLGFNNIPAAGGWTYVVYRDISGAGNNDPSMAGASPTRPCGAEIAVDPFTKKCIAGYAAGGLTPENPMALEGAALVVNRDINPVNGVQASVSCGAARQTFGFDELGRPFTMTTHSPGAATSNPRLTYFRDTCTITLVANDNRRINICIQPETGSIDYCPQ